MQELGNIYKSISFAKDFTEIQKNVANIALSLNHNFIALHIRGGGVVFSTIRKFLHNFVARDRFFPYGIALELAKMELNAGNNIIVFGQDINANKILVNYLKSFKEFSHLSINTCEAFFYKDFNDIERAFFELNFMAQAQKVYTSADSGFAALVRMMSGVDKVISYNKIFSIEEQFEMIKNNIGVLNLHKFQTAASYYKLFDLSKNLKHSPQENLLYLYKALEFDEENEGYVIYITQELFNQKKYDEINSMLKELLMTSAKDFLEFIANPCFGDLRHYYYNYVYFDNENFPYIVFVGSKICEIFSFFQRQKYLRLCYLKNEQERENLLILEKNNPALLHHYRSYKSNLRLALSFHRINYKSGNLTKKEYLSQIPSIFLKALKDSFKQNFYLCKNYLNF